MVKILIVDDAALMRRVLQHILQKAGYQVISAVNGRECLEKVETEKPDLVIMDRVMPEMDGLEALRTLRANSVTFSLPIIIASAGQEAEDIAEMKAAGADGYVSKPFQPAQLLAAVQQRLTAG